MDYEYDVALSFAGEDRTFVEECANIMAALELRVFYEKFKNKYILITSICFIIYI